MDELEINENIDENMENVLDVITATINVYNDSETLNQDFTLSDMNESERWFVREQIKLNEIMYQYIACPVAKDRLKKVMNLDVQNIVVMSRAKKGKIINAVLDFIRGNNGVTTSTEVEDVQQKKGLLSRLNPFSR